MTLRTAVAGLSKERAAPKLVQGYRAKVIRPGTQRYRVLTPLVTDYPAWTSTAKVHRPDTGPGIVQAGTRLHELKHEFEISIDNRQWRVGAVVCSEYRLAQPPSLELTRRIRAGLPIDHQVITPPAENDATATLFDGLQPAAVHSALFPDEISKSEMRRQRRAEGR
jgi:hypothetical protein